MPRGEATVRLVFVLSPYQNAYFHELAEALVGALGSAGAEALLVDDPGAHAMDEDDVFVVMPPHEYQRLEPDGLLSDPACARRTMGISAEQPHQQYFRDNAALGARLGGVLDFSPRAVDAYRALGIDARHLPFGYVAAWDRRPGSAPPSARSLPVLYLGNKHPRRMAVIAEHADALAELGARIRIGDNSEPNLGDSASFLTGEVKRDLLSSTRVLLNVHQSDEPYFEWLRFAEAAHCGTPVLTETSTETEPFVDGEHFMSFRPGELAEQLRRALGSPERLDDVAAAAYESLRARPLSGAVDVLLEVADHVRRSAPAPEQVPSARRTAPLGRERSDPPAVVRWQPSRRRRLLASVARRPRSTTLVAPPGTTLALPVDPGPADPFTIVMTAGETAAGTPALEGMWPWEPWRLRYGQHLGRILVVDDELLAAATAWLRDPWAAQHPHLAVQLFAATRGLRGGHVDRPVGRLHGVPVDPAQAIPPDIVARCADLLGAG